MAKLLDVVEGWTDELGPFTLKADGTAVDLTGMDVALRLRDKNGKVVSFTGTTRVDDTPTNGKVYYQPATGDLLEGKGPYKLHWQVTDQDGFVVFFPNGAPDEIVVYKP
jgi:hypothetical protein